MSEPVNNLLAGYLQPDQRRRIANALMANQYDRPTPQDGPVTERAGILPLGTYANGQTGIAWPGFVAQPVEAFNSLLQRGYRGGTGDTQGVQNAFDVAGAAMLGGLAVPRPRNSLGALSGRIEHQIHEAQAAANPGVDPGLLAQVKRTPSGFVEVASPRGNIDAVQTGPKQFRVAGSGLDSDADIGKGYGRALYDALLNNTVEHGDALSSGYTVSPLAQRMWEYHIARLFHVRKASGAKPLPDTYGATPGTLMGPADDVPVYSVRPSLDPRPSPPPLPGPP